MWEEGEREEGAGEREKETFRFGDCRKEDWQRRDHLGIRLGQWVQGNVGGTEKDWSHREWLQGRSSTAKYRTHMHSTEGMRRI